MSEPSHESASSPPSGAREFHLPMLIPEGIRYNCQGCGRCCSGWPVGLTEKDYARVKDVDWGSLHPELAGKELFRHCVKEFAGGDSLYPHYTTAREDGGCSFLIDNLCFIHGTLGEDSKPSMCKLFPYTFTVTPSGIYVGLVYGSMAAVRNLGNLLSEQRPMLERMWQVQVEYERSQGHVPDAVVRAASSLTAESLSAVEFKINLTAGIPLAWQEYLAVEEALTSVIHCEGHADFTRALLACSRLLSEALRLKSSGGDLRQLKELQPALSAALPAGSAAARATVAEDPAAHRRPPGRGPQKPAHGSAGRRARACRGAAGQGGDDRGQEGEPGRRAQAARQAAIAGDDGLFQALFLSQALQQDLCRACSERAFRGIGLQQPGGQLSVRGDLRQDSSPAAR